MLHWLLNRQWNTLQAFRINDRFITETDAYPYGHINLISKDRPKFGTLLRIQQILHHKQLNRQINTGYNKCFSLTILLLHKINIHNVNSELKFQFLYCKTKSEAERGT